MGPGLKKWQIDLLLSAVPDGAAARIDGIGELLFAGDIDGDGRLDLLVDTRLNDNEIHSLVLYLSSFASKGALFGPPLRFSAVGC